MASLRIFRIFEGRVVRRVRKPLLHAIGNMEKAPDIVPAKTVRKIPKKAKKKEDVEKQHHASPTAIEQETLPRLPLQGFRPNRRSFRGVEMDLCWIDMPAGRADALFLPIFKKERVFSVLAFVFTVGRFVSH